MRTKLLRNGLMLLATGLLASCGGGGGGGGRGGIAKIKFLHIWSENSAQFTKIVNDFMAANDDVQIEIITSDYNNVPTYLNNQIMSNSLPDVFFYWSRQATGYAQLDVCLPLDQYMPGWADTFNDPNSWDLAKYQGKHYSVPFRCSGDVIVYNKTLFEEHGLSEPKNIEEFETLLENLRKITPNPQFSPLCLTGIYGGTLTEMYSAFQNFNCLLTEMYKDPQYTTGLVENGEDNRNVEGRMLEKLKDWNAKGFFGQANGKSKDTSIRNFLEGNAAMLVLNNNNLYLLDDLEDVELGYMAIPSPSTIDYTYCSSDFDGFCVAKNTKYPEACIRFLKYLTSKDVCQKFSEETNSIMAPGGIEYKNDVTKSMSKVMKDCGRSEFSQNEQAYSTSNISMKNSEAIMNYILNNSTYPNGRAVIDYVWSNYVNAMHDAGLNPIPRSVPLKPADFSWLDIRK